MIYGYKHGNHVIYYLCGNQSNYCGRLDKILFSSPKFVLIYDKINLFF